MYLSSVLDQGKPRPAWNTDDLGISTPVVTVVTWNPADKDSNITLSGGNLIATKTGAGSAWVSVRANLGRSSGKYYFEISNSGASTFLMIGVANAADSLAQFVGVAANSAGYYSVTGHKFNSNVDSAYGATYASGDVVGVAYDFGTGSIEYFKNNVSQGVAFTGLAGTKYPCVSIFEGSSVKSATGQFSAADLTYSPPSGFSAWE
jgi:hypothetical protein